MGGAGTWRRGAIHGLLGSLAFTSALSGSLAVSVQRSRAAGRPDLLAGRLRGTVTQTPGRRLQLDSASSRVWFDGSSTFGAFTATTSGLDGWAELGPDGQVGGGRGEVHMRVATLRTGIGLRDRHLREELHADRFPLVSLTVQRVDAAPGPAAGGTTPVVLRGTLTVRGEPYPVSIDATAALRADTLVVRGRLPLRFTQVGMKPPSKLLGAARVHDDFVLRLDGRFLPARP